MINSNTNYRYIFGFIFIMLSACGGGGGNESSDVSSIYINFPGSSNGDFVIDSENSKVRFLKNSRSMETFDNAPTNITLSNVNELIQNGNNKIGNIQLVAGSGNSTIAGLVASNGNMLSIKSDGVNTSLVASNIKFNKPDSTSNSGNGSSSSTSGSLESCGKIVYPGDNSDHVHITQHSIINI